MTNFIDEHAVIVVASSLSSTGDRGALVFLTHGIFRMLLPLGVDFDVYADLDMGRSITSIDVLLLADNGYMSLNSPEWIARLDPDVIWWPAGEDAADAEILQLTASRSTLRTDLDDWVRLRTDGNQL